MTNNPTFNLTVSVPHIFQTRFIFHKTFKYSPTLQNLQMVVSLLVVFKKKVKCTLVQALRLCTGRTAHRGSRGIALPFHDHSTRRGWGVSVTPPPLFTPEKTRYPLNRRLGVPQGRSGQVRKISLPPGFDPRTVQPVASRYTDYATRPTLVILKLRNMSAVCPVIYLANHSPVPHFRHCYFPYQHHNIK
jgi:hypothetical protein